MTHLADDGLADKFTNTPGGGTLSKFIVEDHVGMRAETLHMLHVGRRMVLQLGWVRWNNTLGGRRSGAAHGGLIDVCYRR